MAKKEKPVGCKLTLVSVSRKGKLYSFFVRLPIYADGKTVMPKEQLDKIAGDKLKCPDHGTYTVG